MSQPKDRKDYCGPFWMPSFMRRWMSAKFNASCKIHDLDYESQKYTQQEADMRFIRNMIKQCKGQFLWEIFACMYFLAVRAGGKISFDKAKKEKRPRA